MSSKSKTMGGGRGGARRGTRIAALPVPGPSQGPGAGPGPVVINSLRPSFSAAPFVIGGDAPAARGADGARTVVYIHGIGNKPRESVLKCQWDTALFGHPMGDRTRLAYWVNRRRYPEALAATCGAPDTLDIGEQARTAQLRALAEEEDPDAVLTQEIAALCQGDPVRGRRLGAIAARLKEAGAAPAPGQVSAKILPGEWLRRLVTPQLTKAFLRDVHDFLYVPEERDRMAQSLADRLTTGGGPFVVIAHSQGSMIAYEVLRRLKASDIEVALFVTIGSPLGIQEVQDSLREWDGGRLPFPACVRRWVNVADPDDIVAVDRTLDGEFEEGRIEDVVIVNPESPADPHSGTGYLSSPEVWQAVRGATRSAFAQRIAPFVIAGDLVDRMEDGPREQRHPVMIQLAGRDATPGSMDVTATGDAIEQRIGQMLAAQGIAPMEAELDRMRRFIAARLTRREIEALRSTFRDLDIEGIWRNAEKRALIARSRDTVQARPANLGYGAEGQGICWAVLDTGIRADHPHFSEHRNIIAQYDCSLPGRPQRLGPSDPGFAALDGNGHGTHVAGIIAGSSVVQDEDGASVTFAGMAPRCKLLGFKVLRDDGTGTDAAIIKALDTIALLNEQAGQVVVHGVNLSLGSNFDPSVYGTGHTPLCQELRRLWNQGVVVTIAAGNEGFANLRGAAGIIPANMDITIGDPANLEEAIAVGSVHKTNPHTYGISYFSSRGPTADGRRKPDLVAPGERILSARHDWHRFPLPAQGLPELDKLLAEMSGTSMAAPHVAGIIAAFLSLRREFIGYPEDVKRILLGACVDLRRDPYMQGAGLPNLIKMLAFN